MEIALDKTTLWVASTIAWIFLPIISAVMADNSVSRAWRLPKVYLANAAVFALVYVGYWFQGIVDTAVGFDPSEFVYLTRLDLVRVNLSTGPGDLELICLVSVLVCFGTLLGRNRRQRAAFGCRAAFITFAGFDLIIGMLADYSILVIVKNIIFDFIGAIIFGAVAAVAVGWVFPDLPKRTGLLPQKAR